MYIQLLACLLAGRTTDEASQDVILVIGGYFYELGEEVDVVICSQVVSEDEYGDEETFMSSPPSENFAVTNQYQYQSLNHTMISTEVVRCSYQPYPQTNMLLYSHVNNAWTHLADLVGDDIEVPFSLCDHSVIRVDNQIMVIGGLTLKNDPPRELYYFEPQKSLWIFDLESRDWRQGPDLPLMPKGEKEEELIGYARGTSYLINNDDAQQIIYSGGIQLKINKEINQVNIHMYKHTSLKYSNFASLFSECFIYLYLILQYLLVFAFTRMLSRSTNCACCKVIVLELTDKGEY